MAELRNVSSVDTPMAKLAADIMRLILERKGDITPLQAMLVVLNVAVAIYRTQLNRGGSVQDFARYIGSVAAECWASVSLTEDVSN